MKRLLHLMWFDWMAMRWALAAWSGYLVIDGAFFYLGPIALPNITGLGAASSSVGTLIRVGVSVVIAILLIHRDPTVGTTAFWRTRPIPRLMLLASKVTSVALWTAALPGLVTTGMLLLVGLTFGDACAGGTIALSEQAAFVAMAVVLAIVTKDFVQLIVAIVVATGILTVFGGLVQPAVFAAWPWLETALTFIPALAIAPLVLGFAVFIALYQYATLRTRSSIAMLACALLASLILPSLGARVRTTPPWPASAPASAVGQADVDIALAGDPTTVAYSSYASNNNAVKIQQLRWPFEIQRVPNALALWMAEITSNIEFSDHTTFRLNRRYPSMPIAQSSRGATPDDQPYRSIRAALGGIELFIPPAAKHSTAGLALAELSEVTLNRYRGQPASITATVTMLATQFQPVATMPVSIGSKVSLAKIGVIAIESVSRTTRSLRLVVRETGVRNYQFQGYWLGGVRIILRNATRRQAVVGQERYLSQGGQYTTNMLGSAVRTATSEVVFEVNDDALLTDAWLEGAELVLVDEKQIGSVVRPVRVDHFVFGGDQGK
jgi:hypothetical protein